jgi:lipase
VRLHTHSWGDPSGRPIVCVHGVTGHGERFRKLAEERLGDRRVLAVDLRGHGRSGYEPPWTLETHVADLAESARALGVEHADWIGFSLGGRLVAELALIEPQLVERVILLDPALHLPPSFALEAAEDELADESYASADEAIDARLSAGSLISTPREYLEEEMRQHLVECPDGRLRYRYSRAAAIGAWGEMARPAADIATRPSTLLLLGSSHSHVPNQGQIERYRAALRSELTVVEVRSGHSVLWDAFEATADAIERFVA